MERGHETQTPATDDTPMPIRVNLEVAPTPAFVLQQIAAAGGPWFPATFAAERGTPRDGLDAPLAELRMAGLILATEWVRGVGQGYALTPAGKTVAADAGALERLKQGAPATDVATLAGATAGPDSTIEVGSGPAGTWDAFAPRPPVVVPVLLVTNAVCFFICTVWALRWGLPLERVLRDGHPEVLHRFGAIQGVDLLAGEWWRLFTCCFVHIGAIHLIGNLFALAMMGPLAELLWGRARLLLIYTVSGLAGSALAMALRPDSLLAGASGAIWGVQMSLFVWLFAFRDQLRPDIAADWFRRLTVVFLLNAAVSFLPNVSWEGHLGGGLGGLLTAWLLNVARLGTRPRRVFATLVLALLPVLCVVGVAGAMSAEVVPAWQKLKDRAADRMRRAAAEGTVRHFTTPDGYAHEIRLRLAQLSPVTASNVTKLGGTFVSLLPEEREARALLRDPNRTPQQTAAVREKLHKRKAVTDELVSLTAHEPVDAWRGAVRRFAVAQGQSFELLTQMLEANDEPPGGAWAEWEQVRIEVDALRREARAK